jgi:hypothetical protein
VAENARAEFERNGVAIDQLKACQAEGPDGTELPHCLKVYLPAPEGRHGMVFEISRVEGRLGLVYAGFGLRHPGRNVRQPSVYRIADRRLRRRAAD